jgi:hypothetical protein
MNRPRFSLLGLMAAIAVLAGGLAVLHITWLPVKASAFFALLALILLTATLGSLLNRGASWVGFALFGWGWLFISFVSLAIGSWNSTADRMPIPMPIPSMWLMQLHLAVLGNEAGAAGDAVAVIPNNHGGYTLAPYSLVQICHIVSSLMAACIGGVLGQWLDRSRPQSSTDRVGRSGDSSGTRIGMARSAETA